MATLKTESESDDVDEDDRFDLLLLLLLLPSGTVFFPPGRRETHFRCVASGLCRSEPVAGAGGGEPRSPVGTPPSAPPPPHP